MPDPLPKPLPIIYQLLQVVFSLLPFHLFLNITESRRADCNMTSTLPDTEKAFDTSQSVPQRSESTMTDFPVTPMNKYPFPQRRFGAQHGQVAIHSPKKRMAPGFPNAILTSRRTKYRGFTRDHPLVAHINGKSLQRFPLSKDDWIDAGVDPLTFKPEATNTYKDALCEAADAKINRTYEIFRERLDHGEVEIFPCEIGEETGTTELSNPSVTYYKAHELAKTMAKPFADEKIEIVEKMTLRQKSWPLWHREWTNT